MKFSLIHIPLLSKLRPVTAMVDAVKKFAQDSFESAKYDHEGKIPEQILKRPS
jgi:hypothetical protein